MPVSKIAPCKAIWIPCACLCSHDLQIRDARSRCRLQAYLEADPATRTTKDEYIMRYPVLCQERS